MQLQANEAIKDSRAFKIGMRVWMEWMNNWNVFSDRGEDEVNASLFSAVIVSDRLSCIDTFFSKIALSTTAVGTHTPKYTHTHDEESEIVLAEEIVIFLSAY